MEETDIDGFKLHAADQSDPSFLENFTSEIKSNNDHFYLLADVLDPDAEIAHLQENPALDAVDNYDMLKTITDVFSQAGNPVSDIYEAYEEYGTEKDILFVDDLYT